MVDEIKHVVTKEYEFYYRVHSNLFAPLRKFRPSRFWSKHQNKCSINLIFLFKYNFSDWFLDGGNHFCCYWETLVHTSGWTKNNSFFWNFPSDKFFEHGTPSANVHQICLLRVGDIRLRLCWKHWSQYSWGRMNVESRKSQRI